MEGADGSPGEDATKQLEGEEFAESQPWRLSASGAKVCRSQHAGLGRRRVQQLAGTQGAQEIEPQLRANRA